MATAFISYAHEDQEFVLALADRLAAEELDVEFDQIALRVGDSLIARLADVIATDDFLIAVVSPDSVESDWCRKELALAMTQGIKESRVKVLPVRFREAEMPPALGDTFVADADKFEIESVGHALAAAIKSHRARADIGAAVAEVEDAFHASAFQGSPVQARRRDELVAQLDGSIVECVFEVLVQWDYLTHGSDQVEGLRNAQRRLRFAWTQSQTSCVTPCLSLFVSRKLSGQTTSSLLMRARSRMICARRSERHALSCSKGFRSRGGGRWPGQGSKGAPQTDSP